MAGSTKNDDYRSSKTAAAEIGLEVDLMRPLSAFALRMPHEVKDAARALSQCYFHEWDKTGKTTVKAWGGGSINDVLNDLLRQGLTYCQPLVAAAIDRVKAKREPFAKMAAYLIAEPDAGGVRASDFPNDAELSKLLVLVHSQSELPEDDWTWSRADLMQELSHFDRQLQTLNAALEAMTLAVEANRRW